MIFVWLPGGMSQLESYDTKPECTGGVSRCAESDPHERAGIHICELFPRQAKMADKFNIIRSVHHEFSDHGGGHKRFMTGRLPALPVGFVNDAPSVTSIVQRKLQRSGEAMPVCVAGVDRGRGRIDTFSLGSAYSAVVIAFHGGGRSEREGVQSRKHRPHAGHGAPLG